MLNGEKRFLTFDTMKKPAIPGLLALLFVLVSACKQEPQLIQVNNTGYAQGSTFQIKYRVLDGVDYSEEIKGIFETIDASMSTYQASSLISLINKGDTLVTVDSLFQRVLQRSLEISEESAGQFDPTIGPMVELWGFGLSKQHEVDSARVDSVKDFIGYQNLRQRNAQVAIPRGYKLDFNAIAQGYTVDVITAFLERKGIEHYMVEVGGEVRARGTNTDGEVWKIGIDKPSEELDEADRFQVIIALKDAALATSGNYRKFWVDEETGLKYAHTINPATGFPARNRLLSVSVIAPNAMDADAYATLCMVKGVKKTIEFLDSKPGLEGYLIYSNEDGDWEVYQTRGFEKYIL